MINKQQLFQLSLKTVTRCFSKQLNQHFICVYVNTHETERVQTMDRFYWRLEKKNGRCRILHKNTEYRSTTAGWPLSQTLTFFFLISEDGTRDFLKLVLQLGNKNGNQLFLSTVEWIGVKKTNNISVEVKKRSSKCHKTIISGQECFHWFLVINYEPLQKKKFPVSKPRRNFSACLINLQLQQRRRGWCEERPLIYI